MQSHSPDSNKYQLICGFVFIIKKDIGAVIAPLDDMMRIMGCNDAGDSRHKTVLTLTLTNRQT